jgi:hypothetical protein
VQIGQNESLPFELPPVAEVQQISDRLTGDPHVVEE